MLNTLKKYSLGSQIGKFASSALDASKSVENVPSDSSSRSSSKSVSTKAYAVHRELSEPEITNDI
jgi:hypothetical protein